MKKILFIFISVFALSICLSAQTHQGHNHDGHNHGTHNHDGHNHDGHSHGAKHDKHAKGHDKGHTHDDHHNEFDASATAFHHIGDANIYTIGPWSFPLPCMLYAPGKGWSFFSSGKFGERDSHGDAPKIIDGYVLHGGNVSRIVGNPPANVQTIDKYSHATINTAKGSKEVPTVLIQGKEYKLDAKSTADAGLFGGGVTSFYDFSLTKNVLAMILVCLFLFFVFRSAAKKYATNPNKAPSGTQGLLEPVFAFIQDDVAKPFLGKKWEKYLPFLMSLFFFILGLNLFGQIPFFGGANATGNLSVTLVLAVLAFLVVTFSGNKHYWEHIVWMPGVPAWVKTILTPVEILGIFIKPLTLMLRLFANITAGHIVIIIFVSLIFMFGKMGANPAAAWGASIASILLGLFMMAIELLVAFIQAFVFTILTASYIGAAVEEPHHH